MQTSNLLKYLQIVRVKNSGQLFYALFKVTASIYSDPGLIEFINNKNNIEKWEKL